MATNMTFTDYVTPVPADWLNNVNTVVNNVNNLSFATAPTIAALKLINPAKANVVTVYGYYTAGDKGGGEYWYDASDNTSADNGGTVIVGFGNARWKLNLIQPATVRQFGAYGDGSHDDTIPIQNALDWSANSTQSDFWMTYSSAVRIPKGMYNIRGITIKSPLTLFGDGEDATVLNLISGSNAHTIIVNDLGGLAGADGGNILPTIRDLSLGCNSSGQIAGDGINLVDASVPLSTEYRGGANIYNVTIRAAFRYSVYIGQNRNNGRIENLKSLYSGSDAVNSYGYDWRVYSADVGNSQNAAGWNQVQGGATEFTSCNFFFNQLAGVSIGAGVNASCLFSNCYFDTNGTQGIFLDNGYGDVVGHSIVNSVFRDNSRVAGNNVQPHIQANNQQFLVVSGCSFVVNNTAVKPSYLIQFTGTYGPCAFTGNIYEVLDTPHVPYATGITNDFTVLTVSGSENVSLNQFGNASMGLYARNGGNFDFYDAAPVTNQKRFRFNVSGSVLSLQTTNDAGNAATSNVFTVTRTGTTPTSINTIPVVPLVDNAYPLGGPSFRWTTVYATTGTINTSDANQKEEIQDIPDLLLDAFASLTPKMFKMKGGTRYHVGYLAQDLEQAIKDRGGDPSFYAVWCEDEVNGEKQQGLRYDQIAVLRDALDKRKK